MSKLFNIPNLLTAGNMLCGVLAILCALTSRPDLAVYLIFLGAIFDFLDGFVARKLKVDGEMGKQLDSLADMVTFGVAPGVIMFVILSNAPIFGTFFHRGYTDFPFGFNWKNLEVGMEAAFSGGKVFLLSFLSLLIPFFSLFRLAKFNLDTRQSESFIGLPTPANTLFFMSYPLVLSNKEVFNQFDYFMFNPIVISVLVVVMSVLLVSEIPLFSLKFKHFKWKGNEVRFLFLLISFLFILVFRFWSLALIVFLYLILSLIQNKILKTSKNEI